MEEQVANVAHVAEGIKYVFVDEMARLSGASVSQLREWDRAGELPAKRLHELDPKRRGKPSGEWRVYSLTRLTFDRIQQVARQRAARSGELVEGEYTRANVANAFTVTDRTLKRWERSGLREPDPPGWPRDLH